MEKMFFEAAENGNVEEVKEILRNNPNLDVNWSDENDDGSTALITACDDGHHSSLHPPGTSRH